MKGLAQLDPTYAIVDAFVLFARRMFLVGFLGMAAECAGRKIFAVSDLVASIRLDGLFALFELRWAGLAQLPFEWCVTLLASFLHPATILFVPLIIGACWSILGNEEVKLWAFGALALAQPLDTFLVRQTTSPLPGNQLILATTVMALYLAFGFAGIYAWWRVRGA